MKHCSKILLTIGLVVNTLMVMSPLTDSAFALPSSVSTLPAITTGIHTPVRLAADSSGNIYVTDPSSGGILKYNSAASTVQPIPTSKNGSGIAIAQGGDILVTQGTYIAVIDKTTLLEKIPLRFGAFKNASGIAVDPLGNIYVSDSGANKLYKFGVAYNSITTAGVIATLNHPTGLKYDTSSNLLAVANSAAGTILFVNPADLSLNSTFGAFGYYNYKVTPATVKFTYPQGIAFEYTDTTGTTLSRMYISDSYQGTVNAFNSSKVFVDNIADYGFTAGKVFTPSDVLFEQSVSTNKRIFVANGGGNVSVFGYDNMQPTNIQVINPTLNSLTASWANPTVAGFSFVRVYRSALASDPTPVLIADNLIAQSFTDSGLQPGTTYYYTVRAVAGATEYSNTQPVSGTTRINYNLALSTTSIGSGAGNISPICNGSSCLTLPTVADNTVVSLTALPTGASVFAGWSGDCDPAANNPGVFVNAESCTFTMTANRTVGAKFAPQPPFQVDGYLLDTLQDAHNSADGNGSVIEVLAGSWPGSSINVMTTDRSITTTIEGGFDSGFTAPTAGPTAITGRVNLKSGKTIMKNIRIKP